VACTIPGTPSERGPAAAEALATGLRLDWGSRTEVATTELPGLALPVANAQNGWQYAHWLVAHAKDGGVKRVRFASLEWTAKGGSWAKVAAEPADAGRVLAEVYGDS